MIVLRCINDDGTKYDLDVFESDDLRLDISAIESGQIGSVFGVSSQKLALPPTSTNNEFFGNTYNLGASPTVQFIKTVDCQVLQNGQEIFTGKLYLESVITDNQGDTIYNVVVVNETVDFKFLVQNLSFADLDLSALDHDYTYSNITGSWDKTLLNGGIFYPLVNYGFDEENPLDTQIKGGGEARTFTNYDSPIRVDDFKPAIRVRECLDAIFDKVNYTYTSSLFTSGSYTDDIYMLATKDNYKGISDVNPISQSFRAYTTSSQDYVAPTIGGQVYFPAENYDNANQYSNPTFTAGAEGTYQFEINLVYSIIGYSAVNDERFVDVQIYKNGALHDTYNFDLTGVVQGQMNVVTQYYALDVTDTIDVRVSFTKSGVGSETLRIVSSGNCRFKLISGPQSILGGTINVAENFSEIGVLDFLQGLIEKFNLVIEPDPNERNVLRIETFNDWVDNGAVVDWTDKVDYNKKWEITHPLQSQEKDILFTDEEDNDALTQYHKRTFNKIFGEYQYKSESDLASGTKTIGKFFSPLPIKGVDGSPQTIVPILAEKEASEPYKRYAFKPRLIYHNGRKDALGLVAKTSGGALVQNRYYFQDENAVTHTETDYGLGHHLAAVPSTYESTRDLHFGNLYSPGHWSYHQPQFNAKAKKTAFYEYWSFYINELYDVDSRLVTLNVFLTPNEIPTISLNDKIFINGHYYRINRINGANVTRDDSVAVELIKTLPRKLYYPRRRITELDSTPIDITLDDSAFNEAGFAGYVDYESGAVYTGSAIQPAADRDGLSVYGTDVIWDTQKPATAKFTAQTNLGLNRVDESADIIDVRGDNNVVANNVSSARIEGSNNVVSSYSKFVYTTGTENTIGQSVENSSIQQSTTSSISANTTLATIIGGENTLISGSNKSVAIGQNTTTQRGNSNIVIGNFDSNTKTITDMINTVVINPNRDIESIENLGGEDLPGFAYLGTYKEIGSHFSDNKTLTASSGTAIYLTGSEYAHDSVYNLTWSGGDGICQIYLPEVTKFPSGLRDSQGYKRYLRFTTDGTFDAGKNVGINTAAGDYLNGTFNGSYPMDSPYETFEIYGVSESYWRVLAAGIPDISGGSTGAYGSFYSTQDQSIATSGSAQLVTLNQTQTSLKTNLSGSGGIQMEYNGVYSFTFTATVTNSDNTIHYADFWVKYNGADYPNSTTRASIPARKSSGVPSSMPVTVNLLDQSVSDGDVIELYWRGDSTLLSLDYQTFGGAIPATPSIRATIHAV